MKVEVCIVGAGPVGGTLACRLAEAGIAVAVVDRAALPTMEHPAFDGRAYAIAAGSQPLLEEAGIWSRLPLPAGPIEQIRVSDGRLGRPASKLFLHFDQHDLDGRPLGWMVEARSLRVALNERLHSAPNLSLHAPAEAAVSRGPNAAMVSQNYTDFAMIEPALLRLKAEYGQRIVIDVLGMTNRSELPPELNRIGPSTHASRSYPGFVNWLTLMQPRWHIGLAPLLDTPFNRSKSPIKAMDYAAMGLAVLASNTPVYRGSIADGPAGQLVANDHRAWHAAVDWLIRDQHHREISAVRSREAFLNGATLASHADVRLTALVRLLPDNVQNQAVDQGLEQGLKHDIDLRRASSRPIITNGSADPTPRTRRHSSRGR